MYPETDLPQVLARAAPPASAPFSPSASARAPPRCTARLRSRSPATRPICLHLCQRRHPSPGGRLPPHLTLSPPPRVTPAQNPRCIAVGEIGLDYYHVDNPAVVIQKDAFIAQLRIAAAAQAHHHHCRASSCHPQAKEKFVVPPRARGLPRRSPVPATTVSPSMLRCSPAQSNAAARMALSFYHLAHRRQPPRIPQPEYSRGRSLRPPSDRILVETDAPFLAAIPSARRGADEALVARRRAHRSAHGISYNDSPPSSPPTTPSLTIR